MGIVTARVVDQHLVVPVKNPGAIKAMFPDVKEATVGGQQYCAVPHTLDVARVLNNVGVKVPSPIRTQYDWPGSFTPRWYQLDTAEFFTMYDRCHCHNSMRTGKTLAALWASDFLRRKKVVNKILIVAPLSTLWDVWEQNIFEHFPMRSYAVLHGDRKKRLQLLNEDHHYYIINHHGVKIIEKELRTRPDIDLVIVDEVAEFFNTRTTTMWKPLNTVLNKHGIYRRAWGMTGTPTPEGRPTDAFGQCKLITPEKYYGHFTSFKRETMLQVNTFRWVARHGSEQRVREVLSPSIRFDRSVCSAMEPCLIERRAEMSAEQTKHYTDLLKSAVTDIKGTAVTAVNAAVLVSKLIQTVCISINTMVLTDRGWVPIQEVKTTDQVWDGLEWVPHDGVIYNGNKEVVKCGGVLMTPDHQALTIDGWKTAEEINNANASEKSCWPEVRVPDGYREGWVHYWKNKVSKVAVCLRLRGEGYQNRSKPTNKISPQREALRVPVGGARNYPRDVPLQTVPDMDSHEAALLRPISQRLATIRAAGGRCIRKVVRFFRGVLGRYEGWVRFQPNSGESRQYAGVQPGKLPVGDRGSASKQPKVECLNPDSGRRDDSSTGGAGVRSQDSDPAREAVPVWVERRESANNPSKTAVFDIKNCGPRNRFVVRGESGELRIVHNCGVIYGADKEILKIDFGPRLKVLKELIAQNNEKVVVFAPFTGVLHTLATELRKDWSVEVVEGDTTPKKRTEIFRNFRSTKNPHVVVAHPQCMAHGLDLTAASLIVWYAPVYANKIYEQACARIDGSKQTAKIDIAHIYSCPEERKIYNALRAKQKMQDVVLGLIKGAE